MKLFNFLNKYKVIYITLGYILLLVGISLISKYSKLNILLLRYFILAIYLILMILFHPNGLNKKKDNYLYLLYSYSSIIILLTINVAFKLETIPLYLPLIFIFIVYPKVFHTVISLIRIKYPKNICIIRLAMGIVLSFIPLATFIMMVLPIQIVGYIIGLSIYIIDVIMSDKYILIE